MPILKMGNQRHKGSRMILPMIVRQQTAKTQFLCQVCICPAAASSVPQTCQVQLTDSRARHKLLPLEAGGKGGSHHMDDTKCTRGRWPGEDVGAFWSRGGRRSGKASLRSQGELRDAKQR